LDYRKIILYLLIVVVAGGLWLKSSSEKRSRQGQAELFSTVYAETVVMAELFRNEPDIFFLKRDSIFQVYGVDSAWLYDFRNEMETEEEKWSSIWNNVKIKVDSLTEFYKRHPIKGLDADSIKDDPLIEEN